MAEPMDYRNKRFLVIDDQPMARESLRAIAQTAGAFSVDFAPGYQDAIFRIRNNPPDVILCDYILGEGRSGQQLLEEMRRFNMLPDECIFMMVTGEQSYEQVVSAVELVPDDYIIKPFSPEKLMLRLDRISAKKNFFAEFYREKRKQEYEKALATLKAIRGTDGGRSYRFEVLRQEAEVYLAAGQAEHAEAAYRGILENYEFPWARAGVARALHHQNRLVEARAEIDRVVEQTPYYFDAHDLKANICIEQGETEEAQRVLDSVSKKTPRNYLRKRQLAKTALLNGDGETARTAMADVIANDTIAGAITVEDQLALARSHVVAGELIVAEKTLLEMRESEVMTLNLAQQACYAALMAVASPEKGKAKFAGLRPALMASSLPADAHVDVLRAAMAVSDFDLADRQTRMLMSGEESKRVFGFVRKCYALQNRENDFREIQRQVALQRIHHEEDAPSGAT